MAELGYPNESKDYRDARAALLKVRPSLARINESTRSEREKRRGL